MRWAKFAIGCYIAVILQTGLLAVLFPDGLRPMTFVILANIILLYWPVEQAILGVWIIGLLVDLTSIVPMGVMAFCFGIYGLALLAVRPVLFTESPFAHAVTASMGLIIIYICYTLIRIFNTNVPPLSATLLEIAGQIIVTGITAGLIGKFVSDSKYAIKLLRQL